MPVSTISPPKSRGELIDEYFLENRTRVLEVAAFLDRLDRAGDAPSTGEPDFRMRALRRALEVLSTGAYPRVEDIQMLLSDPTAAPLEHLDTKSARGAWDDGEVG